MAKQSNPSPFAARIRAALPQNQSIDADVLANTPDAGAHYATIERIDKRAPRGGYRGGYVVSLYRRNIEPHKPPVLVRRVARRFGTALEAAQWIDKAVPHVGIRGAYYKPAPRG